MLGAKDLVARGRTDGVDGVICCEPEGGEICHVAKGALRLRLDFTGKMAHGAMPFEGRNPNRAAGRGDRGARPTSRRPCRPATASTPTSGRCGSRRPCCAPGEPAQMNVMPAGASVWLDVRTIPSVDHAELVAELDRRRRRSAGEHRHRRRRSR